MPNIVKILMVVNGTVVIIYIFFSTKSYIFRNYKYVSAEITNLYLLRPKFIVTGINSVVLLNLVD